MRHPVPTIPTGLVPDIQQTSLTSLHLPSRAFFQVSTVGVLDAQYSAGLLVPEVVRTSVAAKAGVQRGDLITKVQNTPVAAGPSAIADVLEAIK